MDSVLDILLSEMDLPADRIETNVPMREHTTFRVGGPCDFMLRARNAEEIAKAVTLCKRHALPLTVLGNGSNMLVRDGGLEGLVLLIGEEMGDIAFDGETASVGAGCLMSRFAAACLKEELSGMEALSGIPGSIGGACAMNAGAYEHDISQILTKVDVVSPDGRIFSLQAEELELGYRASRVMQEGLIVTRAYFRLTRDDPAEIRARMDDYSYRRRSKQPLAFPSAGSTFKRPAGYFAGKLIEESGLKGVKVGGAQVSPMHAGFIVNTGSATAQDVLDLIYACRSKVHAANGVWLEPEVRIIGRK